MSVGDFPCGTAERSEHLLALVVAKPARPRGEDQCQERGRGHGYRDRQRRDVVLRSHGPAVASNLDGARFELQRRRVLVRALGVPPRVAVGEQDVAGRGTGCG
jgi:hypothetical protein